MRAERGRSFVRSGPEGHIVLAGNTIHKGLLTGNLSPDCFADYGRQLREGPETMRKLVYAFHSPNFSFKEVITRYPEAADQVQTIYAVACPVRLRSLSA